ETMYRWAFSSWIALPPLRDLPPQQPASTSGESYKVILAADRFPWRKARVRPAKGDPEYRDFTTLVKEILATRRTPATTCSSLSAVRFRDNATSNDSSVSLDSEASCRARTNLTRRNSMRSAHEYSQTAQRTAIRSGPLRVPF